MARRRLGTTTATRRWQGRAVKNILSQRGIIVHSRSARGLFEEAADRAGLARCVARLGP